MQDTTDHDTTDAPTEGDYVRLTFTGDHGSQSPIKGRVTDVDHDPTGSDTMMFSVDNGENNRTIHYHEGVFEGDAYAMVTRYSEFSGSHKLGENADWEELN